MKTKSPKYITLIIVSVLSLLFTSVFLFFSVFFHQTIHLWVFFWSITIEFCVGYFLVNYFINHFIYDKIKLIYRTILNQKINKENDVNFTSSEDVLGTVNKKVSDWAIEKQNKITQLQEKETYQKEFVGNISHELKTPIFSIQGYVLTLLEGGLEDENINRKYLLRTEKSVERMITLIDDLDNISRFDSANLKLNFSKIDIIALTNDVIESLEYKAEEENIEILFNQNYNKPIWVNCDPKRIAQVLTNLLVNSIKYGNLNGKTEIRFHDMEDTILVEVSDNGMGIKEKDLSRLFERFYRVEESRSRDKGGSGLGLAIAKHIMDAHHQTINVRSTVGAGTTFSFTLEKSFH